jgi:hypothetical protein
MRAGLLALICAALTARAAWTEAAWPACAHVGGREIAPGLLYKQVWARELMRALNERAAAVDAGGAAAVYNASWPLAPLPAWWTEAGITNRVLRYDREVLVVAKRFASALTPRFLDPDLLDPTAADLAAAWHARQVATGARATNLVASATFTAWQWGCLVEDHSAFFAYFDMERVGTPSTLYTRPALLVQAQRPAAYFEVSPFRLLEGLCDPDESTTAPLHVLALSDQGTSPHDSGLWYWTDLGWHGLREVLTRLRHQVNPAGVTGRFWWPADGEVNSTRGFGATRKRWFQFEGGPGELVEDGDLATALEEQAADFENYDYVRTTPTPGFDYMHKFTGTPPDEPSPGSLSSSFYDCTWVAVYEAERGRYRVERSRLWPPDGVSAVVKSVCDVRNLDLFDRHYIESWTTEALDGDTLTSGTSTVSFATVYGESRPVEANRPGDPAGERMSPALSFGAGIDYNDNYWGEGGSDSPYLENNDYLYPSAERGNKVRHRKTYETPVLVVTYTWTYP